MFKNTKAFCGFAVRDLEQAKKFYGQVLGLEITDEDDKSQGFTLKFGDGGKAFVYGKPNHVPATFTILNFLVDDVARTVAALRERGVKFEKYTEGPFKTNEQGIANCDGQNVAWFTDPSGNIAAVLEEE